MSGTRRLPADARRREIVLAALRVFSEGSYSGATTSEIAREAGITEPVLYRHFASKRDLWFACLDAAWEEYRAVLDGVLAAQVAGAAPATPPPVARWKKALMSNLWMQGITEAGEDREIRRFVARHMRAVHDHIAGWIREQQALGSVPPDRDADAEAWVMVGGALLRSVAHRLGGLLDDDDLASIQRERTRWLSGATDSPAAIAPPAR